jgi:hypothetical protein
MSELIVGDGCVLRTARKHWTCVSCSGAIAPGQRFVESSGDTRSRATVGRHCLRCAHDAGLAQHPDPIADALERLPPRLRRIIDGAPATLIVPESWGGPSADELAIASTILRLLRLAR